MGPSIGNNWPKNVYVYTAVKKDECSSGVPGYNTNFSKKLDLEIKHRPDRSISSILNQLSGKPINVDFIKKVLRKFTGFTGLFGGCNNFIETPTSSSNALQNTTWNPQEKHKKRRLLIVGGANRIGWKDQNLSTTIQQEFGKKNGQQFPVEVATSEGPDLITFQKKLQWLAQADESMLLMNGHGSYDESYKSSYFDVTQNSSPDNHLSGHYMGKPEEGEVSLFQDDLKSLIGQAHFKKLTLVITSCNSGGFSE